MSFLGKSFISLLGSPKAAHPLLGSFRPKTAIRKGRSTGEGFGVNSAERLACYPIRGALIVPQTDWN
jgi:hypothetical protein